MPEWKPGGIPGSYETSYSTQPNAMDNLALLAGAMATGYGERRAAEQKGSNTLMNTIAQQYAAQGRLDPAGAGQRGDIQAGDMGFNIVPGMPDAGDEKERAQTEKYRAETDLLRNKQLQAIKAAAGMGDLAVTMQMLKGSGMAQIGPDGNLIMDPEAFGAIVSAMFPEGAEGGKPTGGTPFTPGMEAGEGMGQYEGMSAQELYDKAAAGDQQAAAVGKKKYPNWRPTQYSSGR